MRARVLPRFRKNAGRICQLEARPHDDAGDQLAHPGQSRRGMSARESAHRVVAIDGPAASGKSSVARALARRIGFDYVNSGAMYRAVTWHVLNHAVAPDDAAAIVGLLENTRI